MGDKKFSLTAADRTAVDAGDANYINNKGAAYYRPETYDKAVEYYRLAAAMGSLHAVSNLGYCYLYGRSIEPNTELAIAYFKTAASKGDVDAAYKLGDIYGRDKWGMQDKELSIYYYRMAASFITREDWSRETIKYCDELDKFPSLCYALARELMPGGALCSDLEIAYAFLKHAETGYQIELDNGSDMYEESYRGVLELLEDERFDRFREEYDDEQPF